MPKIDDIMTQIQKLFIKKSNTIYEVVIVDQVYSDQINIFFEYYKIGHATTSQQIARLEGKYREDIPDIKQQIRQTTGLTVHVR